MAKITCYEEFCGILDKGSDNDDYSAILAFGVIAIVALAALVTLTANNPDVLEMLNNPLGFGLY